MFIGVDSRDPRSTICRAGAADVEADDFVGEE
jgi:hypothetical protein